MAESLIGSLRVFLGLDTAQFRTRLEEAQSQMRQAGRSFERVGQQMQRAGQALTVGLTLPIVAFGAASVRTAGSFEGAMIRVRIATQASAGEMERLSRLARDIGSDTIFGASEAAGAIEELARTGLSTTQILGGAARATVDLAAAVDGQLEPAAAAITDTMNVFGRSTAQLPDTVNQITGAVNQSKFEFADYQLALSQAGARAAGLGVTFEDFNTAIAGTAAQFASGSDAGTSFGTFIQRLTPQSREAAAAIEQYGLSFFNASGNLRPLAAIAEELRTKLSGLDDEAKSRVLTQIFGSDAIRTALGLMGQGAEGLERVAQAIRETDAAAQAAERMEGFQGQLEQLKGAFEELAIAIGESGLLGAITTMVGGLTALVEAISQLPAPVLATTSYLAGLAAVIGPLVLSLGFLAASFGTIQRTIALSGVAARATTTAMTLLGRSMAFLLGPWGLALGAISLALWEVSSSAAEAEARSRRLAETSADLNRRMDEAGAAVHRTDAEIDNLGGTANAASGEVWDLTGRVYDLADAHDRAAVAARNHAVELSRALMMEAGQAWQEANDAYQRRARADRRITSTIGPDGRQPAPLGAAEVAAGATAGSREAQDLARATADFERAQAFYYRQLTDPFSNFAPQDAPDQSARAPDYDAGGGGKTGPSAREIDLMRERLRLQAELDVARAGGDLDAQRSLEDQLDLMSRIAAYEDAGLDTAKATASAEADMAAILRAREQARTEAQAARRLEHDITVAQLREEHDIAYALERQQELQDLINGHRADGYELEEATRMAVADQLELDEAREIVRRRLLDDTRRAHDLELARLRGDRERVRLLERQEEIQRRARQYAAENRTSFDQELGRATQEVTEEDQARLQGDFRAFVRDGWAAGMKDGLSGLGEWFRNWVAEWTTRGMENALNRLADRLYEIFSRIDWGGGAHGGGVGGILSQIGTAFGWGRSGQAATSAGNIISAAGGFRLPGFATGGSFMVNGKAGIDKNLAMLKLTNGERVSVETSRQQRQGSGLSVQVNNFGAPAEARVSQDANGNARVDLYPVVREGLRGAAAKGDLARLGSYAPQQLRRA